MKLTQEKKELEDQLAAGSGGSGGSAAEVSELRAEVERLKQELEEKSTAVTELEEEMEGIKEEVQTHNTRPLIRAQR